MLDYILNPEGVTYTAFVIFVVGSIAALAGGFVYGLTRYYKEREKRDGVR